MRIVRIVWYEQWQKFLVSAGADKFGMRRRTSFWYEQAQVNLVCPGADHFGMRRRKSIWYAQAQVVLVCAGACYFGSTEYKMFIMKYVTLIKSCVHSGRMRSLFVLYSTNLRS